MSSTITLTQWKQGNLYGAQTIERHGSQLFLVIYHSTDRNNLCTARNAAGRTEPTLAQLYQATAYILGLNPQQRCGYKGKIRGNVTYSRDDSGTLIEHFLFFNEKWEEASGQDLQDFLLMHL